MQRISEVFLLFLPAEYSTFKKISKIQNKIAGGLWVAAGLSRCLPCRQVRQETVLTESELNSFRWCRLVAKWNYSQINKTHQLSHRGCEGLSLPPSDPLSVSPKIIFFVSHFNNKVPTEVRGSWTIKNETLDRLALHNNFVLGTGISEKGKRKEKKEAKTERE